MDDPTPIDGLGLGTVSFRIGRRNLAFEVLDAWRGVGGRLIDTAAVYGIGESERVIGAWLRARGVRDDVVRPGTSPWTSTLG